LAFWGVLWGPLRILHPLWQGKGALLRLPRSTSASGYKHYKCYITMLQCQIWGRGTGNASEWKAFTHWTKGKTTEKSVAPSASSFIPVFPLTIAGKLYDLRPIIYPASAPLPNLKAYAESTKNQLSNACLRSRNGGVGAEICLRKVKWDYLAGRGLSFSRGRPTALFS